MPTKSKDPRPPLPKLKESKYEYIEIPKQANITQEQADKIIKGIERLECKLEMIFGDSILIDGRFIDVKKINLF
jgi:hypothetical protein